LKNTSNLWDDFFEWLKDNVVDGFKHCGFT
jgi:hypothetical protein